MLVAIFFSTLGATQAGPAAQPLPALDVDGFQSLAATLHLSSILPLVSQSWERLWVPEVRHTIYSMESLGRF